MSGWVKLHRNLLDNPIVCKDKDYFTVWIYLLLKATHTEINMIFNKKKIILSAGQLITGRVKIAEKFNISESKVQRILKTFKTEQQIEQQTTNQNRLITILNWEQYQDIEQPSEQPVNNKRTTDEQQMNTNKNVRMKECKNVRSKEEDIKKETRPSVPIKKKKEFIKPDGVSDEIWDDFKIHRKSKKAAITETAIKAYQREADKAKITLEEAIVYAIEFNWIGFRSDWYKNKISSNNKNSFSKDYNVDNFDTGNM